MGFINSWEAEYEEAANQACLLACDICPECIGSGEIPDPEKWHGKEWCLYCDGSGKHPDNHKEKVK